MREEEIRVLGKDIREGDEVLLFDEFRRFDYVRPSTYHDDFIYVVGFKTTGEGTMYLWSESVYTVRRTKPLPTKRGTVVVFDNGVSALRTGSGWLFSTVGDRKTYTDREMQAQLTGNEKIYNEGGHE